MFETNHKNLIVMDDEADDVAEFNGSVGTGVIDDDDAARSNPQRGEKARALDAADYHSWGVIGNDQYMAASKTVDKLPPAVYKQAYNQTGQLVFMKMKTVTDNLFLLADTVSIRILESIEKFWASKERFDKFGMIFKRGILLFGPAGSGKTVTVQLLAEQVINKGGLVTMCENPKVTSNALTTIRRIEPTRPIVNIMEDIDTIIENYGEQDVLPLLDGENQVNNIVHVATTNFPERLDARLANRPSRFDEIRKVDMPKPEIRKAYIKSVLNGKAEVPDSELEKWVKESDGMSIAHLREMVVAVMCLERDYESTIRRLKSMFTNKPKSNTSSADFGFSNKNSSD